MEILMKALARSAVLILGLIAAASAWSADTILVLKSRDLPPFNAAADGFTQAWAGQNSHIALQAVTLGSAADRPETVLGKIGTPKAIVAVGTEATQWAIQNTKVPVVFCMVANAEQNVFSGLSKADAGRVSGVSLDVPVATQFIRIAEYLPKAHRIGVLYDPKKSARAMKEATEAARNLGIEIVAQAVTDESLLPDAVEEIVSRIDVLWAPVDSTVYNSRSARFVLGKMVEHKIPVVGFSENMVKAGALLAPCVSYASAGKQTAELLAAVLAGKVAPLDDLQSPNQFDFIVNRRVLLLMNDPIPKAKFSFFRFIDEQ